MQRITYRVKFLDGGIGTRSGLMLLLPIGEKTIRLAIQEPVSPERGQEKQRFLVHVSSGAVCSRTSIDQVMRERNCTEQEAAILIFDQLKAEKGEKATVAGLQKSEVLNPSDTYL